MLSESARVLMPALPHIFVSFAPFVDWRFCHQRAQSGSEIIIAHLLAEASDQLFGIDGAQDGTPMGRSFQEGQGQALSRGGVDQRPGGRKSFGESAGVLELIHDSRHLEIWD